MTDDDVSKARFVSVHDYVEQRAAQVADLLQMVDNSSLVSGEVTKGPRTAAQRLPRHMRRRAMSYEVRRFPKGLRNFAAPYLINTKHRKKPPSRFFRRRSRNLLLNYIRRQRRSVWLETHIWHAKRFHIVNRWGYRLPDRSFQRSYRPCYRDSIRHCTVRDKSYLTCFLISHSNQLQLINLLNPLCSSAVSPTFAFKSSLDGKYEISTLLFHPGQYPSGFIGPARFLWSKDGELYRLAIWIHPSCRDEVFEHLAALLNLEKTKCDYVEDKTECPTSVEEWRLSKMNVHTDIYKGKNGIEMHDLRDQLVRIRLYGPLSMAIVADSLKLAQTDTSFSNNHSEWQNIYCILSSGQLTDGSVFSLLVEDPRITKPNKKKIPNSQLCETKINVADLRHCSTKSDIWNRDIRIRALEKRLTDSEMNAIKGQYVGEIKETPAKIPVLVVVRNSGCGRSDTLCGVELIAPSGFGMDFWLAFQMRTARASGRRDDLSAHFEAGKLDFPTDVIDTNAGCNEEKRIKQELELQYEKRPYNRRVLYWPNMSIKYPFTFKFDELIKEWKVIKDPRNQQSTVNSYVLRDRHALNVLSKWMQGKHKLPAEILSTHMNALIPVELECVARGKPKRFGIVCLPTNEDILKIKRRQIEGPVLITQTPRRHVSNEQESSENMDEEESSKLECETKAKWQADMWKDVVSTDQTTREKAISLKSLFPDNKIIDRCLKRKVANRKKKDKAKRSKAFREEMLRTLNEEYEEKERVPYKEAANRLTIGRIIRGGYSFYSAHSRALAYIPLCVLPDVRTTNSIVLVRNTTSKYYHPVKLVILRNLIEI